VSAKKDPYGPRATPTKPKQPVVDTKPGHEDPTEVPCPTCERSGVCPTCRGRTSVPTDVAAGIEDKKKREERCNCQ
jgi:hypothetical protein